MRVHWEALGLEIDTEQINHVTLPQVPHYYQAQLGDEAARCSQAWELF